MQNSGVLPTLKRELTTEEVLRELQAASDDHVLVALYINLIKAGQTSTTHALVAMVQGLVGYARLLEERQELLFSDTQGEA
jgi:hypothetical protein